MAFLKRLLSSILRRPEDEGVPPGTTPERDLLSQPESIRGRPKPWTQPVDREKWRSCDGCGRLIPVSEDSRLGAQSLHPGLRMVEPVGTCTYVCPFCGHGHVGTETWTGVEERQVACYGCNAPLDGAPQCTRCGYPRGWMRVTCPFCDREQAVYAPHFVIQCTLYHLECVYCELHHVSPCIC